MAAAARAGLLAAFTAGAGPAGDGDYSAVSWLIHRTRITRGAAVGHSAWAKRTATHPRVLAALAAGQVSESVGRVICLWTDKLPQEHRDAGDEQLLAAFAGGLGLADLASLFAEMSGRARGDLPRSGPGAGFADREVKLATTIGGAGVLHQIVIHRWGWTLVVNPDGTTSAWNKNKTKVLHSHGPPARAG